ncbi:MAG TPA: extracellular solute-binding protein, partial [Chloroflexota bacterium]|nr:extracellular solute-binding protein [Chloroflexota bacterium]
RSSPGLDSASPVTLHFLDTPFDSENTRALVAEFQSRNPSARVARVESPAGRYLTDLTTTLASGTTQDLAFVPAGSLARLVAGGWLGELGRRSDASFLDSVELPWLREQTTLGATRYAAPAWVRLRGFFANRTYLQAAGQAPPTSFDALQVAARAIQRQGLGNNAFYWPLKNGPGIFPDDYLADGGSFFDAQLAPRFASDPRYSDVLNWRLHAIWDWDLVDPRGLSNEQDNDDSFPHGWAAFAWSTYDQLRYWQTSGRFLQSGHLINALVPSRSASHLAIGAADLYAIPTSSQQSAAAWELLYYLTAGEDYRAARLRWQKSGLLFGYAPLVADNSLLATADDWADPAVLRAQLAQICAPPGVATPWRDEWLAAAQVPSALLVRRILTPAAFTQRIAQQWNTLREGWISSNGGP